MCSCVGRVFDLQDIRVFRFEICPFLVSFVAFLVGKCSFLAGSVRFLVDLFGPSRGVIKVSRKLLIWTAPKSRVQSVQGQKH